MAKKIALILGGMGSEAEVSRKTGASFKKALEELKHNFVVVEAGPDLPKVLTDLKPDVALLALHGKYGEDGTVQGICEYLKIPYTGSGVFASALAMDKIMSKQIFQNAGIPTPNYEIIDVHGKNLDALKFKLGAPCVVKPSRDGSSVAVTMVYKNEDILSAVKEAAKLDHLILMGEMIIGSEVTVPILNGKSLTPIEIVPKTKFYNYENKYTSGATDYFLPARLPADVVSKCEELALASARVLRTRAYSRVDLMVDKSGHPFVLEVNTLPGCTETSLLPKSAAHLGIPFSQVIQTLIDLATTDYAGVR